MSDEPKPEKPAVLQDQEFTLEEGTLYRLLRTGAIWTNKLFFSSLVLLGLWLLLGLTGQVETGCVDTLQVAANGTADQADVRCSVWLSTTAKYLGAMSVLSFLLSIALGLLGLVVGKQVIRMAPTSEEVGGGRMEDAPESPETEDRR